MVGVAPLRSGCALPLADVRGVAASSLASRQRRLGSGLVASGYACGAPAGRTARSADLHATAAAQLVGACSCSRHVALGPGAADAVPAHPRGGRVVARAVPRGGQGRYSGSSASSAAPSSGMADDRVRQRAQQVEAELRDLLGVHVPRLPLPGEKFSHLQCPYCGSEVRSPPSTRRANARAQSGDTGVPVVEAAAGRHARAEPYRQAVRGNDNRRGRGAVQLLPRQVRHKGCVLEPRARARASRRSLTARGRCAQAKSSRAP